MHRPKQFAQMESEAERRRKTRSLRASLLKRGWLRENKQNGLTSWGTERDGKRASKVREGQSAGKMTKWTEQGGRGRGKGRKLDHQVTEREREAATTTPNLALYWKTKWLLNREKHWKLKIVCFVIFPFLCAFAFQPEHIKSLGCRKLIQCFLIISINDLNTKKVRTKGK